MGHLFSRALKRLTQCSTQARAVTEQQQQAEEQANQLQESQLESAESRIESIPVGQSIDSTEYAAFEPARTGQQADDDQLQQAQHNQDAEEAAIKIQALIRGHLTRKALRADGQQLQQQQQLRPMHELGHSQFDEASLLNNPPSGVFGSSSPLRVGAISPESSERRLRLESIDEAHNESQASSEKSKSRIAGPSMQKLEMPPRSDSACRSISPASPALSEANASIELNAQPLSGQLDSASIDISDHNVRPTDQLASVLHLTGSSSASQTEGSHESSEQKVASWLPQVQPDAKLEPEEDIEAPPDQHLPEVEQANQAAVVPEIGGRLVAETPDSLLSSPVQQNSSTAGAAICGSPDFNEETAAIKIQSAFRGYRTRKNSPYRHRSPSSPTAPVAAHLATGSASPLVAAENGLAKYDEPVDFLQQPELRLDEHLEAEDLHDSEAQDALVSSLLASDEDDDDNEEEREDDQTVCSLRRSSRSTERSTGQQEEDNKETQNSDSGGSSMAAVLTSNEATSNEATDQVQSLSLEVNKSESLQISSEAENQLLDSGSQAPSLDLTDSQSGAALTLSEDPPAQSSESNEAQLQSAPEVEEAVSGLSSPAGGSSSNGNESEDEEDEDEDAQEEHASEANGKQLTHELAEGGDQPKQPQQAKGAAKGKNKRNRNRRKGGPKK